MTDKEVTESRHAVKERDEIVTDWLIAQLYNNIVESYISHKLEGNTVGDLLEAPVFRKYVQEAQMNSEVKKILDIGTGTGWLLAKILRKELLAEYESAVGIDVSDKMIEEARTHFDDNRISFEQVSISDREALERAGLVSGSFDLLVSANALDCVADLEAALNNSYNLLKPGGYFIISIRHPQRNAEYASGDPEALWVNGDPVANPESKTTVQQGWYRENWPGTGENSILRYYRSLYKWLMLLENSGFEFVETNSPRINQENRAIIEQVNPDLIDIYSKRPGALMFVVKKPKE